MNNLVVMSGVALCSKEHQQFVIMCESETGGLILSNKFVLRIKLEARMTWWHDFLPS